MKALLTLLAAAWITTDANATSERERAPGLADTRFVSTYLYAAGRRATDDAFALVLPEVNANTMEVFLDRFAACRARNTHAIVLLDQAGWHGEKTLMVPVGGAIHSIKSVHIPLHHELPRTHGGSRRIALYFVDSLSSEAKGCLQRSCWF